MNSDISMEDSKQPATDHPITITTPRRRNPFRAARRIRICLPLKRQATIPSNHEQTKKSAIDKLPAASSSPSLSPSNHQSLALFLPEVGFHWDAEKLKDEVEKDSCAILFEAEWEEFIGLVSKIPGGIRPKKKAISGKDAWKCFQNVIMPKNPDKTDGSISYGYDSEENFDNALFSALRKSLLGFVEKKSGKLGKNWIVLRNSHIGFGRKIGRTTLGFRDGYALSCDSRSDHGCFVLGTYTMKALNIAHTTKLTKAKRRTCDTEDGFWFNDMTSAVELKLQGTSCQNFIVESIEIERPDLKKNHGPMGQAMLYSMDVWHCLARRGVVVETVPVAVLAGKSKLINNNEICSLQAHVKIPKDCGPGIVYSIDKIVAFDGTAGFILPDHLKQTNVSRELTETRDQRAIAIYIRTMRIGLENALRVIEKCNMPDPLVFPVSLGCYPLLLDGSSAHLVASPISREPQFYNPTLNVHQGELFSLSNLTESSFAGFKRLHWFIEPNEFNNHYDCLVKVSCLSVHHTYIKHGACEKALLELHNACAFKENEKMKKSVANVLLGFFYVVESTCLVTIMKDLQKENFQILKHQAIHDQQKLPELWRAFCVLVTSVLLPMAERGIIHHDIRSSKECTYNILIRKENNNVELRLIDFDSIILFESALNDSIKSHDNSVHMKDLFKTVGGKVKWKSAHRYLFWQVLWIAYRWHLPPEENHYEFIAHDFLFLLLNAADFEKRKKGPLSDIASYDEFKNWLGIHAIILEELNNKAVTGEDIPMALEALQKAFQREFLS